MNAKRVVLAACVWRVATGVMMKSVENLKIDTQDYHTLASDAEGARTPISAAERAGVRRAHLDCSCHTHNCWRTSTLRAADIAAITAPARALRQYGKAAIQDWTEGRGGTS